MRVRSLVLLPAAVLACTAALALALAARAAEPVVPLGPGQVTWAQHLVDTARAAHPERGRDLGPRHAAERRREGGRRGEHGRRPRPRRESAQGRFRRDDRRTWRRVPRPEGQGHEGRRASRVRHPGALRQARDQRSEPHGSVSVQRTVHAGQRGAGARRCDDGAPSRADRARHARDAAGRPRQRDAGFQHRPHRQESRRGRHARRQHRGIEF